MSQLTLIPGATVDADQASEQEAPRSTPVADDPGLDEILSGFKGRGPIGFAFRSMEIADKAIRAKAQKHPERANLLNRAFRAFQPRWEVFGEWTNERLLRAHMDELAGRIVDDGLNADMGKGTAAEACVAMAETSLRAPLKHEFALLYGAFFTEAFGREVAVSIAGERIVQRAEEDQGHPWMEELHRDVLEHMRDDDRQNRWKKLTGGN